MKKTELINVAESNHRLLTNEEIGEPKIRYLKDLRLSEDARWVVMRSMDRYRDIEHVHIKEFVKHFVLANPEDDTQFFREIGHDGKNITTPNGYGEVLKRGLPEIKQKLKELNYLK